jgi:hypothetical protein
MIVMIVAKQYRMDVRHILDQYTGFSSAPRTYPRQRMARSDQIGSVKILIPRC